MATPAAIVVAARQLVDTHGLDPRHAVTTAVRTARALAARGHGPAAAAVAQWDAARDRAVALALQATDEVVELASYQAGRSRQHRDGTAFNWKHGYIPLNVQTALLHKKRKAAASLHASGAPFAAPEPGWYREQDPGANQIRPVRGGGGAVRKTGRPDLPVVRQTKRGNRHAVSAPVGTYKIGQTLHAEGAGGEHVTVRVAGTGRPFKRGGKDHQYHYTALAPGSTPTKPAGKPVAPLAPPAAPKALPVAPPKAAPTQAPAIVPTPKAPPVPAQAPPAPPAPPAAPHPVVAQARGSKPITVTSRSTTATEQAAAWQRAMTSGQTQYMDSSGTVGQQVPTTARYNRFNPDGSIDLYRNGQLARTVPANRLATDRNFGGRLVPVSSAGVSYQRSPRTVDALMTKVAMSEQVTNLQRSRNGAMAEALQQAQATGSTRYMVNSGSGWQATGDVSTLNPNLAHYQVRSNGDVTFHPVGGTASPVSPTAVIQAVNPALRYDPNHDPNLVATAKSNAKTAAAQRAARAKTLAAEQAAQQARQQAIAAEQQAAAAIARAQAAANAPAVDQARRPAAKSSIDDWSDAEIDTILSTPFTGGHLTSTGAQDQQIGAIWAAQGFNDRPALVTSNDQASLLAAGHIRIHRGISGDQAGQWAEDFKTADQPFFGLGVYGNGHYFATDPTVARQYAGRSSYNPDAGSVMDGFLHKDARVVDHIALSNEQANAIRSLRQRALQAPAGSAEQRRLNTLAAVIGDTGRYAAMVGVDAIKVKVGVGSDSYYVVQNRSALIMEN